ncbi:LacI family DNA-binding transcriptional regulator [Vagococcus intermedius]|uniref:LacI family transcriptional regulator n=1 Tax=Vagococcus intermedius TaxID=2991418 RepID=A0AAF0CUW3_9ENTE|nr:LacI family DNA-binding transcriptional regulator [Vagococcus intermedius]WEG73355.1 LacI family transcriptional regulator [Vagococcus intermedius]WEG75436.1 LacI family transcriptional regulator [Vagococcus intermedius]
MKLTIKDIANKAGVSITTVSQILNNKGSRFSEETRNKVLRIVAENNYKPDFFAKSMITKRSRTIGMIVPDVTDLFFSKLIEGVETYLNALGYMIILCNSKHSVELEKKSFEELMYRSVEGIIVATPNLLDPFIMEVCLRKKKDIPVVLVDMGKNTRNEGKLIVEEYKGVHEGVSYLIKQGHRKIGFLREVGDYYQLSERITGYLNCLEDYNIPYNPAYIEECFLTIQGGYEGTQKLLHKSNREITALVCSNDQMAIGAYQAIYEAGLKIPEDISVIGFDDLETGKYLAPALTTIHQPVFDIGFSAAKFAVDAIENPYVRIPNKIFPTQLVIRESVKNID